MKPISKIALALLLCGVTFEPVAENDINPDNNPVNCPTGTGTFCGNRGSNRGSVALTNAPAPSPACGLPLTLSVGDCVTPGTVTNITTNANCTTSNSVVTNWPAPQVPYWLYRGQSNYGWSGVIPDDIIPQSLCGTIDVWLPYKDACGASNCAYVAAPFDHECPVCFGAAYLTNAPAGYFGALMAYWLDCNTNWYTWECFSTDKNSCNTNPMSGASNAYLSTGDMIDKIGLSGSPSNSCTAVISQTI